MPKPIVKPKAKVDLRDVMSSATKKNWADVEPPPKRSVYPMKPVLPSTKTETPKLKTSSYVSDVKTGMKKDKKGGNAAEIAFGAAQLAGGIGSDLLNKSPKPVEDNTSALLNTMAMETKNAANSTASRLMDVATGRADRDFAANQAEARRQSGGNAAVALMTGVQSQEQGKEAVAKASVDAAGIIMQANQQANQLGSQATEMSLQSRMFNSQQENERFMAKKQASSDLIGAGTKNIIDAMSFNSFKKEEAEIKRNNTFASTQGKPKK